MVKEALGLAYKGMQLGYSVEETPLGTGGAIRAAARVIACEQLLVLNGDTFFDVEYLNLAQQAPAGADLMACRRVGDVGRYGAVQLDASGRVIALAEKGAQGPLINGGPRAPPQPLRPGRGCFLSRPITFRSACCGRLMAWPATECLLYRCAR